MAKKQSEIKIGPIESIGQSTLALLPLGGGSRVPDPKLDDMAFQVIVSAIEFTFQTDPPSSIELEKNSDLYLELPGFSTEELDEVCGLIEDELYHQTGRTFAIVSDISDYVTLSEMATFISVVSDAILYCTNGDSKMFNIEALFDTDPIDTDLTREYNSGIPGDITEEEEEGLSWIPVTGGGSNIMSIDVKDPKIILVTKGISTMYTGANQTHAKKVLDASIGIIDLAASIHANLIDHIYISGDLDELELLESARGILNWLCITLGAFQYTASTAFNSTSIISLDFDNPQGDIDYMHQLECASGMLMVVASDLAKKSKDHNFFVGGACTISSYSEDIVRVFALVNFIMKACGTSVAEELGA